METQVILQLIKKKLYAKFEINPSSRSWDICPDGLTDGRTDKVIAI